MIILIRKHSAVVMAVGLIFLGSLTATAQTQLASLSINSGGAAQTSTSYAAVLTIGQPVSGTSSSTGYKAMLGFWHTAALGVGVQEGPSTELPASFSLAQNYPNPFNPSTEIPFSLPTRSDVRIDIYNILGQKVMRLVNERFGAGDYVADWNGCDQIGNSVASGVYFYRLTAGEFAETKRMILLK